jgi:hypothetical protein
VSVERLKEWAEQRRSEQAEALAKARARQEEERARAKRLNESKAEVSKALQAALAPLHNLSLPGLGSLIVVERKENANFAVVGAAKDVVLYLYISPQDCRTCLTFEIAADDEAARAVLDGRPITTDEAAGLALDMAEDIASGKYLPPAPEVPF